MAKRITFALVLLALSLIPSQAIFFKAFSGKGRNLRQQRKLNANAGHGWFLSSGNTYLDRSDQNTKEIHANSFGFESRQQDDIRSGGVDTQYFKSGPQNINTLANYGTDYYEVATLTAEESTQKYGFFSGTDTTSAPMSVWCNDLDTLVPVPGDRTGLDGYCANFELNPEVRRDLHVEAGDYELTNVANQIIPALLSSAAQTSGDSGGKIWGGLDNHIHLSDNALFSTNGERGSILDTSDNSALEASDFQVDGFDRLDKQCYTPRTGDRKEFDEIQCDDAQHLDPDRANGDGYTQNSDIGLSMTDLSNSNPSMNDLLNGAFNAELDTVCDDDDTCGYESIASSRYPKQEYCLAAKDRTIFKALFGCADDQRVDCNGMVMACAGGIDASEIDSHVDYVPAEWYDAEGNLADLLGKTYGDQVTTDHVCTPAEISIANELSAYLDKVDQDITHACEKSIEVMETASQAYVDFVTPVSNGGVVSDFYALLKATWAHAEFTVRSMKIQEQVVDRMLKYRDWTLFRFSLLDQTPTGPLGGTSRSRDHQATIAAEIARVGGSKSTQDASAAYVAFRNAWDTHIAQYSALSTQEFDALEADLNTLIGQIDSAKAHAKALAEVQATAAAAVATISTHFRKKVQLWTNIEHVLEKAFYDVLAANKALDGGLDREMMYANYGRTYHPVQPTSSLTPGSAAAMTDGSAYSIVRDGDGNPVLDGDGNIQYTRASEMDTTDDYSLTRNNEPDDDYSEGDITFKTSDGEITTDYVCSTDADCPGADNTNYPAHDRAALCYKDPPDAASGVCVLSGSQIGDDTTEETHTVHHDKTQYLEHDSHVNVYVHP